MNDDEKTLLKIFNERFWFGGSVAIIKGEIVCAGSIFMEKSSHILGLKFKSVSGDFDCGYSDLYSLQGAPQTVGKSFKCANNNLFSLKGGPQHVGEDFDCADNLLGSLEGAPQHVGRHFLCKNEQPWTSLQGAPRYVGGDFVCVKNLIRSLRGAPEYVGQEFRITYNEYLPLLPLLKIKGCKHAWFIRDDGTGRRSNEDLSEILNRYLGTGTRGMLPCAMEMIKAGYGSNAKL